MSHASSSVDLQETEVLQREPEAVADDVCVGKEHETPLGDSWGPCGIGICPESVGRVKYTLPGIQRDPAPFSSQL